MDDENPNPGVEADAAPLADSHASSSLTEVMPVVYDELRRLAANYMRGERRGHTLQTTALVNEAYLRLAQRGDDAVWPSRADFCAAAAQAVRRVLVDHARARRRLKRGGPNARRVKLDAETLAVEDGPIDPVELDDALSRLAELSARQARVVELRYFGGLTEEETALALDVSRRTVQEDWRGARAWLHRELSEADGHRETDNGVR